MHSATWFRVRACLTVCFARVRGCARRFRACVPACPCVRACFARVRPSRACASVSRASVSPPPVFERVERGSPRSPSEPPQDRAAKDEPLDIRRDQWGRRARSALSHTPRPPGSVVGGTRSAPSHTPRGRHAVKSRATNGTIQFVAPRGQREGCRVLNTSASSSRPGRIV